jgi:hypothetical protein
MKKNYITQKKRRKFFIFYLSISYQIQNQQDLKQQSIQLMGTQFSPKED